MIDIETDYNYTIGSIVRIKGVTEKPLNKTANVLVKKYNIPDEYQKFLYKYGRLNYFDVNIYGVQSYKEYGSLEEICDYFINNGFTISDYFLPIEYTHNQWMTVLIIEDIGDMFQKGMVVRYALEDIFDITKGLITSNSFNEYVTGRIREVRSRRYSFEKFKKYVDDYQERYNYNHVTGGSKAKNYIWKPYRFCVRDVVMGLLVSKFSRDKNAIEIGCFLSYDTEIHKPDEGAAALLLLVMSDAFKYGGRFEVFFNQDVENSVIVNRNTLTLLEKKGLEKSVIKKSE